MTIALAAICIVASLASICGGGWRVMYYGGLARNWRPFAGLCLLSVLLVFQAIYLVQLRA